MTLRRAGLTTLRQNSDSPGASSVATVVELTQTRRVMPWMVIARVMWVMPLE